jgi:hypothetical protein
MQNGRSLPNVQSNILLPSSESKRTPSKQSAKSKQSEDILVYVALEQILSLRALILLCWMKPEGTFPSALFSHCCFLTPQQCQLRFIFKSYSDWLRAGRPRGQILSPGRDKNFLFSTSSRLALGSTQPPIQWLPGAFSPGVKCPGHEADHSPQTIAEVKKMWIYTSSPSYAFMA